MKPYLPTCLPTGRTGKRAGGCGFFRQLPHPRSGEKTSPEKMAFSGLAVISERELFNFFENKHISAPTAYTYLYIKCNRKHFITGAI